MKISADYKNGLLSELIKMKIGEVHYTNDFKIEAIKIIIDWGLDVKNGFSITFSKDMTKIRKDLYKVC